MSTPALRLCNLYGETERPVAAHTVGRQVWMDLRKGRMTTGLQLVQTHYASARAPGEII
jgi:hypothetical protein